MELFIRCFICDVVIETPQYNSDHEDYDPCDTCKQVIADTVGAHKDTVYIPDEYGDADELIGQLAYAPEEIEDD